MSRQIFSDEDTEYEQNKHKEEEDSEEREGKIRQDILKYIQKVSWGGNNKREPRSNGSKNKSKRMYHPNRRWQKMRRKTARCQGALKPNIWHCWEALMACYCHSIDRDILLFRIHAYMWIIAPECTCAKHKSPQMKSLAFTFVILKVVNSNARLFRFAHIFVTMVLRCTMK